MEERQAVLVHITDADSTIASASSDPHESSKGEESRSTPEQAATATCIKKEQTEEEPHWGKLPSMIYKRTRFGSAIHENKLYVFGGLVCSSEEFKQGGKTRKNKGNRTDKVEMFDSETNSWTMLPNMTLSKCNCSCAVIGNNIYVTGGEIHGEKNPTYCGEVFNTKTKTWSTMPPMIYPNANHASVAVGKSIYAFGGYQGSRSIQVYDTATCEWTVKSKMNDYRYSFASAVVNNKIYAIGGMKKEYVPKKYRSQQYHRYLETMEEYDPKADKWITVQEKMGNRRAGCSAVVVGSTIKVLGGHDEKGSVSSIESFDTLQQKWSGSFIPPSKHLRKHFAAEIIRDSLVVIGGMEDDSDLLLNSVEKYSLPTEPTNNLSIPAINKLSNIDPDQVCLEHIFQKTKCPSTAVKHTITPIKRNMKPSIKPTDRKLRGTPRISYKRTREIRQKGTKRKIQDVKLMRKNKNHKNKSGRFQSTRVIKGVEDGSSLAVTESYDGDSEISYIDLVESDEEGVQLAMQDNGKGEGKEKKKRKNMKKHDTKEKKKRTTQKPRKEVKKNVSKLSLKDMMNAKEKNINKLEIEILGKTQKGSLEVRSEKLKAALTDIEKQAFGKAQTGDFRERFENLKCFSGGGDLL